MCICFCVTYLEIFCIMYVALLISSYKTVKGFWACIQRTQYFPTYDDCTKYKRICVLDDQLYIVVVTLSHKHMGFFCYMYLHQTLPSYQTDDCYALKHLCFTSQLNCDLYSLLSCSQQQCVDPLGSMTLVRLADAHHECLLFGFLKPLTCGTVDQEDSPNVLSRGPT